MEANVTNENMNQWGEKKEKNMIRRSVDYRQDLTNQIRLCKFLVTPAAAGARTSRHCPISQRRRASSAAEKALFSFLFFSSAPETTIFLLTRCSATLPMCATGGTCVIDAPRCCGGSVFCTWYLYKYRLYIMIYWEKETKCKIRHSAPPIARMEWSCVFPMIRLRLAVESDSLDRIVE